MNLRKTIGYYIALLYAVSIIGLLFGLLALAVSDAMAQQPPWPAVPQHKHGGYTHPPQYYQPKTYTITNPHDPMDIQHITIQPDGSGTIRNPHKPHDTRIIKPY